MELAKPGKQHEWLAQLVGDWTYEADCAMGPDLPRAKARGRERVRSIGGLWIVAEGDGEMPGCDERGVSQLTIGYDPQTDRYVGSWIGSMMTKFWIYDGALDATGAKLALDAEGPAFSGDGTSTYRDEIEIVTPNHKRLTSYVQEADGSWREFMTADYRRAQ